MTTSRKRSFHVHMPEGSNPTQEKFINYLMKKGKKSVARRIFADVVKEIQKKSPEALSSVGGAPEALFEKAIENVKPSMEVRPKRIGGAVYQIPMEVKPGRRTMLAFRWILDAARNGKGGPVANRIAKELMEAAAETGIAIKKKEDTHKMAAANKAFAHYAKY